MPAADSGERRQPLKTLGGGGGAFSPEPEHLPCPRCDSTNTKFCYYNNYNLSQPRHFCKACRRYWTRGGTLRNVPVGGGTRKNNKRSRTAPSAAASPSSGSSPHDPTPETGDSSFGLRSEVPLTAPANTAGSFTSLLGAQGSSGWMATGGPFGLGLGSGLEDVGLGLGRGAGFWPYQESGIGDALSVDGHGGGGGGSSGVSTGGYSAWQFGGGESALADGECFVWPDLAISMSGNGFK